MRALQLRREEVYDALLDDEVLAQLPSRMATAYGGRSCVLHWWHTDGTAEIVSHNGYYPDDQMQNYAENFTGTDLWSIRAVRSECVNKVWNADELVLPSEYERSEFYNEWIRQMGDDTFHCLGTVVKTRWGMGFVGIHRGRSQGTFEEDQVRALTHDIVDLRRMLAMRGRLSAGLKRAKEADAILDSLGHAFITVTADARVVHTNAAGSELIRRRDGLTVRGDRLAAGGRAPERELRNAIALAAHSGDCRASAVSVPRRDGGRYDLTIVPLNMGEANRRVLVAVRDSSHLDCSLAERLRALFGLSPAEAEIAMLIANGHSPADISDERAVSIGTVRLQIKSIALKMECGRQSAIASVVNRLLPLRSPDNGGGSSPTLETEWAGSAKPGVPEARGKQRQRFAHIPIAICRRRTHPAG
jgi:DNA-binding CsgD family transcriptional regulator